MSRNTGKTAVLIGAGQIGRGFIGQVLAGSGYRLVFIDVSEKTVRLINGSGRYKVIIVGAEETECFVEGVTALMPEDPAAARAIAECVLVTTSVGPSNLAAAAAIIAPGLTARYAAGNTSPIDVIACENMEAGTATLFNSLKSLLGAAVLEHCGRYAGFPDAEVSRMAMPSDDPDPLTVRVEEYMEWIIDRNAVKGDLSDIAGLELTDDPTAYIRRKMFTLTGHAMLGYLGYRKGYDYIYRAAYDREIFKTVYKALTECGRAWSLEFGMPEIEFYEYVTVMLRRFSDTRLKDACTRICREPLRKLAEGERFMGPARTALKYGIRPEGIAAGISAALEYDSEGDEQACRLSWVVRAEGKAAALRKLCGMSEDDELYRFLISQRSISE